SLRAGARASEQRPRLHAGTAGAVSRLRRGPAVESAARQYGRRPIRIVPHGARPRARNPPPRAPEPRRGAPVAQWVASVHRELGGGRALLPAWRAGRRHRRRDTADRSTPHATAGLPGPAGALPDSLSW